jgi:sodium-dependent phosphate transporter
VPDYLIGSMRVLLALTLCQAVHGVFEKTQIDSKEQFQEDYLWIFILALFFAFFMAWGIGANDVANSFASSVGSKSLTLKQAVIIATIVEFLGCVTMGASVTDTVRKGIIDGAYFKDNPEVLMLGMLSALLGAGLWLCLCSFLGSPVSTTHSIIGSLIGVSLACNPESLNAWKIFLVVLSWFASPLCSGILAAGLYLIVRAVILRSESPVERGLKFFPLLLYFTFLIVCLYTVFKNPQTELKEWRKDNAGPAVGVAFGMALLMTVGVYAATIKSLKKGIDATSDEPVADKGAAAVTPGEPAAEENEKAPVAGGGWGWNKDLEAEAAKEDTNVAGLQDAERFTPKTEKLFAFLQVICASFGALAHGANDCANAVGPLAAIAGIYDEGEISSKVDVPIWILILGGVGISVGLLTYGYNVIKAIGMKLIKVTPSRGFAIEIGAFLVVIIGTNLGIPLSTTHCKVGATVAVGMCESNGLKNTKKGVNWRLMGKVGAMWVLTLVFASVISSSMFAILTASFHPMTKPLDCGMVSTKLGAAQNVAQNAAAGSLYTVSDVEQLFADLDTNNDDLLDSDELAARCPPLDLLQNGEDLTVEKFGRRRRRTPEEMDKDDFLQYTCMSDDKLEHMDNKQCEPLCASGFQPDDTLKCKLDGDHMTDDGAYIIRTMYSGFTTCVQSDHSCLSA